MTQHFLPAFELNLHAFYVDPKQRKLVSLPVVAFRVLVPPSGLNDQHLIAVVLDRRGISVDADAYEGTAERPLEFVGVGRMIHVYNRSVMVLDGEAVAVEDAIAKHAPEVKR